MRTIRKKRTAKITITIWLKVNPKIAFNSRQADSMVFPRINEINKPTRITLITNIQNLIGII